MRRVSPEWSSGVHGKLFRKIPGPLVLHGPAVAVDVVKKPHPTHILVFLF